MKNLEERTDIPESKTKKMENRKLQKSSRSNTQIAENLERENREIRE